MNAVLVDSFAGLVVHALERMAFVLTEPSGEAPAAVLDRCVAHAWVQLQGPLRYGLTVSATPGIVREIAAGMLGQDEASIVVEEHGAATVAELANILGGELVDLLTVGDASLRLGLPNVLSAAEVQALLQRTDGDGCHVVVGGDSGQLLVVVHEL